MILSNFVSRSQHGPGCGKADPVGRTFVRNSEPPTSSARDFSLRISAEDDRAGTGDHNHARPLAECRRQRDLHVAHDFDFPRNNLCNDLAHRACDFRAPGTRRADARTEHLLRIDSCSEARLTYGLLQSFTGASLADTRDVAAT